VVAEAASLRLTETEAESCLKEAEREEYGVQLKRDGEEAVRKHILIL
jgi:hypothetical protein